MNDNLNKAVLHLRSAMSKAQSHIRAHPTHEVLPKALEQVALAVEILIREMASEKAKETPADNQP